MPLSAVRCRPRWSVAIGLQPAHSGKPIAEVDRRETLWSGRAQYCCGDIRCAHGAPECPRSSRFSRFAAWKNLVSAAALTVRRRLGSSERQPESVSATGSSPHHRRIGPAAASSPLRRRFSSYADHAAQRSNRSDRSPSVGVTATIRSTRPTPARTQNAARLRHRSAAHSAGAALAGSGRP